MGTCNGVFSSCAIGGYAMESKCHLGQTILYDTVSNLSWGVDVRTHTIATVIEKLLSGPWPPALEDGREVPKAASESDCVVSGCSVTKLICPSQPSHRNAIGGSSVTLKTLHNTPTKTTISYPTIRFRDGISERSYIIIFIPPSKFTTYDSITTPSEFSPAYGVCDARRISV